MDLTINQIEPGSRYFKSVCRILERRIVKENLVSNGGTLNYDNVTYESDHLLIALTGKKIIGYASILDSEDAYYIYQIAVGKEYQGQGVGSALVERVKAIAASDDDGIVKAKKHVTTRLIVAVIIFLLPSLIKLLFELAQFDSCAGIF